MTKPSLAVAAVSVTYLMVLGAGPVHAGNNAALAEAYFKAISGGNPDGIASFYAEDAEFHWIGGPLAGVYKGKDKIRGVWDKFGKAAGRINHEVVQLTESSDDKPATVTAWVKFTGEGEVPVKFTLAYKDGKIASETWQVDKTPVTAMAVQVTPPAAKPEATKPVEVKPIEANVGNLFSAPAVKNTGAPAKPLREAANAEDQPAKPEPKPEDKPKPVEPKAEAKDSNPVPPPAAKNAAAPAEPERKQTDASDQPAAASDYKPQSARVPQANAVEAMPMPVPANRSKKAAAAPKKPVPNAAAVAAAKAKAGDEKDVEAVERAEEEKWARSRRYYGYGYGYPSRYYYGYDRYSYGPYRYRSYGYDDEPVYTVPYRGYSYYGYDRGYYGYGGYGRY